MTATKRKYLVRRLVASTAIAVLLASGANTRQTEFEVGAPSRLTAELEARGEDVLLVGNGALVYRRELEQAGRHVEFASPAYAFPAATALVMLRCWSACENPCDWGAGGAE